MTKINVPVPHYTTVSMEIDVSDYLSEIEVEVDEELIGATLDEGGVDLRAILRHFDIETLLAHLVEHFAELDRDELAEVEIPDSLLLRLFESRNELLKLALTRGMTSVSLAEKVSDLHSEIMKSPPIQKVTQTRQLVRHLLLDDAARLAVTDAIGAHYAGAHLYPLLPDDNERAKTGESS